MDRFGTVLYCADIDVTRAFYECLGFSFVEERHNDGKGPRHYACSLGGFVIELYRDKNRSPERRPDEPDTRQRIICNTDRFDDVLQTLQRMETPLNDVQTLRDTGLRTVLTLDPDARYVQIFEVENLLPRMN